MPAPASKDRAQVFGYALVVLGLVAIGAGLAWRQLAPHEMFWTAADAREYTDAYEAAHEASIRRAHTHGDGDAPSPERAAPDDAEVRSAKARFQAVSERLASARAARNYLGYALSVAGAALAGLGVVLLRRSSHAAPRRSGGGQG